MAKRKAAAASSDEEGYDSQDQPSGSESPGRPVETARRSAKKAKKNVRDEGSKEDKPRSSKKSDASKPSVRNRPCSGPASQLT
ncbi:hypothetical protein BD414DRAFT_170572 [Trametes punicea]|nr:hypothetical protein BD414DRAFT_170572 [Trametes punicea]